MMKKRFVSAGALSLNSSPKKKSDSRPLSTQETADLSPELVPIVTLLLSQNHRRYQEGIFMLYYDLNGDGKPADREWKEVYGILTGNQLAYWDAANLAEFRNNPEALLQASSKPNYINFTDSVYNAMQSLPAAKQNLDNVIVVSTTLKNRFIIQFKSSRDLSDWYLALRLASYEYLSLQEAYTGALLSARGSRLSDIRTVLAEKRYNHEDWVSIRYGSGMAWKRCYAVVEPSINKKKAFTPGRILFYESDQMKKKQLMAVVSNASSVTAVYPESPQLIDFSTMLKLDGYINFSSPNVSTKVSKKSLGDFKNTSLFIMPEAHSAVPGYDTLIRFLIPLLDSFGLYGRPTRLKADRIDPDSLLFGLPTLPHVHFLENADLKPLTGRSDYYSWDVKTWKSEIKTIMKGKLAQGYTGCGSSRGLVGAVSSLSSPTVRSDPSFGATKPSLAAFAAKNQSQTSVPSFPLSDSLDRGVGLPSSASPVSTADRLLESNGSLQTGENRSQAHKSVQLAEIYQKYSDILSPSDQFNLDRMNLLNGSHEQIVESELPEPVRLGNGIGAYPREDPMFSDDDDEEDKVDARQIGMLRLDDGSNVDVGALGVPQYADRNSSYSSVKSPMTQYKEFNKQFSSAIDDRTQSKNDFNYSDSDESQVNAPSPPPHSTPQYPLHDLRNSEEATPMNLPKMRVAHGTTTPQKVEQNGDDYLSIHSESGKIQNTVDSSPYSDTSEDKPSGHRPHFISSPNPNQSRPRQDKQKDLPSIHIEDSNGSTVQHARDRVQVQPQQYQEPHQGYPVLQPQQQFAKGGNNGPPYAPSPLQQSQSSSYYSPTEAMHYQGNRGPQSGRGGAPSPHGGPGSQYPPGGQRKPPPPRDNTGMPQLPQQKSYPNSQQFGYQSAPQPPQPPQNTRHYPPQGQGSAPPQHHGQQHPQQHPQQYQQQYQQYLQPPQQYQPQQYQQQHPQQYQQYPHHQQHPQQGQPRPQRQQFQGGVPPSVYQASKVPPRQTGIPPSVNIQGPRPPAQQSQSAANMRGFSPTPQGQFQYQVDSSLQNFRKVTRKAPTNNNNLYTRPY